MADFIQALDPSKLILAEAVSSDARWDGNIAKRPYLCCLQVLSFAIVPFSSPVYNFPLFLFGTYAQDSQEATESLKLVSTIIESMLSLSR